MVLAQIKACWLVQYYRPMRMESWCWTEARSHDALVFFLLFLALVAILFSRAGRLRGSPKEHSCEIIEKSVQQCQRRSLLKQKLQCMHVTFMENQPLLWRLKAWWTEGQMNEWKNKQTEGNLDILDWYLTSYPILIKSIILLGKYEPF